METLESKERPWRGVGVGDTPSSEWPCQPAGICKAESGAGLEGVGQQGEAFLRRDRKFINSSVPPAILI